MQTIFNLNKFEDSWQALEKISELSPPLLKWLKILDDWLNILFSSNIYTTNRLSINVYKTFKYGKNKVPYCNVQGSKKWKFKEIFTIHKPWPTWINF